MATLIDTTPGIGKREGGWADRLFSKDTCTPEYQELKFTLHKKLLDRINERVRACAASHSRASMFQTIVEIG